MKKLRNLLLALTLISTTALAKGRIQNEDVKSQSDIQSAAGTITGNLSSGSACIASPSSTTGIAAGMYAYDSTTGTNIPSGTTVLGIGTSPCTAGQIKLSANAAGTATGDTITFGGQLSQLVNDSKIYVTANSINKRLDTAISTGLIGGGGGGGVGTNYLSDANGQAYPSGSFWTVASGTGSADTTNYTDGTQSIKVTASSQQSKLSQDVTPSAQLSGQNMQATAWVKTSLTNVQVCARVGGVETNCQPVSSANTWSPYTATMIGPASGSIGIEVSMTSSGTGTFNAQLGYVGKATNTAMVAPSMSDFQVYTPSLTGFGTISASNFQWRRNGDYLEVIGSFTSGTTVASLASISLPTSPSALSIDTSKLATGNSISTDGPIIGEWLSHTTNGFGPLVSATATDATKIYFGAQGGTSTGIAQNANSIANSSQPTSIKFRVPITSFSGSSQQQGYRVDATPASWSGSHNGTNCEWSESGSSFADMTSVVACTFSERQNRNFGTVTTAGSSLPGITFTPPRAGRYWVCANSWVQTDTSGGYVVLQLTDGTNEITRASYRGSPNIPVMTPLCGIWNAASVAASTIKIKALTNTGTGYVGASNGSATPTNGTIEWSVVELDAPMPAPYLVGSVTSNTPAQERVERVALANNGSTASVASQSGSWVSSVVRNAVGNVTINFTAGEFSAAPTCTCTVLLSNDRTCIISTATTSSAMTIQTYGPAPAAEDLGVNLICMGPH